jgi:hypothetical protein
VINFSKESCFCTGSRVGSEYTSISLREQLLHLQTLGFNQATKGDHGEQLARTNEKMGTQDIRPPMKETDHLAAIPAEGDNARTGHGASASNQHSPHQHQAEDQ